MTLHHQAFDAALDDLPIDEWTLEDFDAIDEPAELDSFRSSIATLSAFDD